MLEEKVEAYLVRRVKELGGEAEKFVSPGRTSVPDRICTFFPKHLFYVECKATGKKATPAQQRDHDRRRAKEFRVYVVDSYESVDRVLDDEMGILRMALL